METTPSIERYRQHTLGVMIDAFRSGQISKELMIAYANEWNSTPGRFTKAIVINRSVIQKDCDDPLCDKLLKKYH